MSKGKHPMNWDGHSDFSCGPPEEAGGALGGFGVFSDGGVNRAEPHHKDDPWVHRSHGMRCHTCMWYVAKASPDALTRIGRCRRHAPTMGGFPCVYPTDWCGDHRVDETKI